MKKALTNSTFGHFHARFAQPWDVSHLAGLAQFNTQTTPFQTLVFAPAA
jgi:hypothetical protein